MFPNFPIRFLILLLVFSLLATSPLLLPGFYTNHDGENHLFRLAHFSHLLSSGSVIPRWDSDLDAGRGSPVFLFAYPLPYYLGSLWHSLGLSYIAALKFTLVLFTVLASIFYYLWVRQIGFSPKLSVTVSLLYLLAPYRFLDLYVRAALGEIVFLGLLPLAFYLLQSHRWWWFSFLLAALLCTHLPLFVIFTLPLFIYAVSQNLPIRRVLVAYLLGLGISAFYLIPALFFSYYLHFIELQSASSHLVPFTSLLYSPWTFGFSTPGQPGSMAFQLGFAFWLVIGFSLLSLFRSSVLQIQPLIILSLSLIALFFVVFSPFHLWDWSVLQFVQFPWRLLSIPLFFLPLSAAYVHKSLSSSTIRKIFCLLLVFLALYSNRNHIRINAVRFSDAPDSYFLTAPATISATPGEFRVSNSYLFSHLSSHPVVIIGTLISIFSLFSAYNWNRNLKDT